MEHVLAKRGTTLRYVQQVLRRLWYLTCDGCNICRETQLDIRAAGFQRVDMEEFDAVELTRFPGWPFMIIAPHIAGTAMK